MSRKQTGGIFDLLWEAGPPYDTSAEFMYIGDGIDHDIQLFSHRNAIVRRDFSIV